VYNNGVFTMSGSAVVNTGNVVYLTAGKTIAISGSLSGLSPVATITLPPAGDLTGTQVLSAAVPADIAANYTKFALAPDLVTAGYFIDSDGVLRTAGTGTVTFTFAGPEDEDFTGIPLATKYISHTGICVTATTLTINLSATYPGGTTYQWYKDADPISGKTANPVSLTAWDIGLGSHTVSVQITKPGSGGTYSKSLTVVVTEN
jgi:hypothetical protein